MYHHFVPISLHLQAEEFINQLKNLGSKPHACPYCQQTGFYIINAKAGHYQCKNCHKGFNKSTCTPYHRLAPLGWLPLIAEQRLCGKSCTAIRYQLDYCTPSVVKRRVNVIEQQMAKNHPPLYAWYKEFIAVRKTAQPIAVIEEAQILKHWVNSLLQADKVTCPYCQSENVKNIAENRPRMRCQSCWRYFSGLTGSGLENLGYSEYWLTMIDMFIAGETIKAISERLKISHSTVTKARRTWLGIMRQRGLMVLFEWVNS
ncbi:hypothetical protein RHO14_08025 [Orbus wheelerorum]|uniref:helix-turn-helix domain-containing protein n=1 Tax=Orbus wheelerorum TaxID=3074111 RepID=UPI00370D31D5